MSHHLKATTAVRRLGRMVLRTTPGLVLAACVVASAAASVPTFNSSPAAATCTLKTAPSRIGNFGGIVPPEPSAGASGCHSALARTAGATAPSPSYGGTPPLTYHSGSPPVLATTATLTVVPVYWAPSGHSFSSSYQNTTQQYLTDVVHDNATQSNVFANLSQYTDAAGNHIRYSNLQLGTTVNDADAFPSNGCTPDTGTVYTDGSGYNACLDDTQLRTELKKVTGVAPDLGHIYLLFLPQHVESCMGTNDVALGGSCTITASGGSYCGYHSDAPVGTTGTLLYADLPYAVVDSPVSGYTCSSDGGRLVGGADVGNQSPNSDIAADTVISVTSHELNEAMTDPKLNAWYDSSGYEIGDDCAYIYGDSSTYSGAAGSEYNQTINGHHYFTQTEFSNLQFGLNSSFSCVQETLPQVLSFTSSPGSGPGSSPHVGDAYVVAASSTGGLTVSVSLDSSSAGICTLNGTTVTFMAAGTCTLDANQSGNEQYNPAAQVQQVIDVAPEAKLAITSEPPSSANAGTSFSVGVSVEDSAGHLVAGDQSDAVTVAVTPGSGYPGTAGCATDPLTVTNGVASFSCSISQGGPYTLTASSGTFKSVMSSTIDVVGPQTITYGSTAPTEAGVGSTYTPSATASSGLPVTITVDSSTTAHCTISGGTVTMVASGPCTIDANQAGNTFYQPAPQAQQTFTVLESQTVTFTSAAPSSATVGGATYMPSATSSSGLGVTISVDSTSSSVCSISGGVVSFQAGGTCTLDAVQAGDGTYSSASTTQSFAVAKLSQTVQFNSAAPASAQAGGATYTPSATSSSGLGVTITVDSSSSSVCSISAGVVSFQAGGTCTLDAVQAGDGTYSSSSTTQSFAVATEAQSVSFTSTAPAHATADGPTYTPTATASSGLAVTITVDSSSSGVCSISAGVVSFQAGGTCTLDANQAGNATFNPATTAVQSFAVAKAGQTVSFTTAAPAAATVNGATYSPVASASSGLPVSIVVDSSSSSVCSISGGAVSFQNTGTCTLDAHQAGNATFDAAGAVQSFAVAGQPQTISFTTTPPSGTKYGGPTYTPNATATSGLTVTITSATPSVCSMSGGVVDMVSAGTCTLDANQGGNSVFAPAPQVIQTFAVSPAPLTITASSPTVEYGAPMPAIDPIYSGLVNGESAPSPTPPTCVTASQSTTKLGKSTTSCSGGVDSNYSITYVNGTMTVVKATTHLVAAKGQETAPHQFLLSATLTSDGSGGPLSGASLTFKLGIISCSAKTNSSGVASCTVKLGAYLTVPPTYTVSYAGNVDYVKSSATANS